MEKVITDLLLSNAKTIFNQEIDANLVQFQQTRKEFDGDLTLVTFPFTKILKKKPEEIGEIIGAFLVENEPNIAAYSVIKGFLNIVLSDDYWANTLNNIVEEEKFGFAKAQSGKTLMVEYSSPNTNKPLHLGHLRNIFLGHSVAEILKANGHHVIKTQIINDRGIHVCKSMLAWERFAPMDDKGQRETPQNTGVKGDHFVGKYYILFDQKATEEAFELMKAWQKQNFEGANPEEKATFEQLFARFDEETDPKQKNSLYRKIAGFKKDATTLQRDAQEMLIKWEAKDPQTYLLWNTMNGWVYEGFEKTYQRMDVTFDHLYYESDTYLIGKDHVTEGVQKGVFYTKEDGSIWIDLTDEGLDEKLLLRSDGTAVYMTQDIGTAIDRYTDYPALSGIIYTVGNEQDYHFNVLFSILKKLGYDWAQNCFHLSYGMVDLPDGKMKSREGKVVDADDIMEEVVQKAKESAQERGHLDGMSEKEKKQLFEMVGLGGLKYYLLKVDPKKRMKFNPEESIDLNGNTAPFIQYAHARIKSILRKAEGFDQKTTLKVGNAERILVKIMSQFPIIVKEAGDNYSPALLANYTFELVKAFNNFYQNVSILNEADENLKNTRLVICNEIANIIANAMELLGIKVPEKM